MSPDVSPDKAYRLSHAVLSDDGLYRYSLYRRWSMGNVATFIMLNPSTADAALDDPTIRRCVGFARAWGMGGVTVLNLYAYRATDPKRMLAAADPVGPENDAYLTDAAGVASAYGWPLIAAWGANAQPARVAHVLTLPGMSALHALGTTKAGQPRHPLYLRADSVRSPWPTEAAA